MSSPEAASACPTNSAGDMATTNGINGTAQPQAQQTHIARQLDEGLARTPSLTSFSLTEYSAKPTPSTEDRKTHMKKIVPDEFLLPNGNPDVSPSCCLFNPCPCAGSSEGPASPLPPPDVVCRARAS